MKKCLRYFLCLAAFLTTSITPQGSTNWPLCTRCGSNVMILQSLIELVSLFQTINAKPSFLSWSEGGHCHCACYPHLLFYVPYWDESDINVILRFAKECWEPGLFANCNMPALTGYWTRAVGLPGGCANYYTITASPGFIKFFAGWFLVNLVMRRGVRFGWTNQ